MSKDRANRTARWIRWIARGIGSLVVAFWLFIGILQGMVGSDPWTGESTILSVLTITSALGVLIAWWREGLGGIILVIAAVAHSTFAYFAAGHNHAFAMLISGGPWMVVGILFLISWRMLKGSKSRRASKRGKNDEPQ